MSVSVGLIVFVGIAAAFIGFMVWAGRRGAKIAAEMSEKQEALFASMFPDLQPYYHPKKVLEFVRARLAQPPARGGMRMKSPPGFEVPLAQVSFDTDKKGRERELWVLLDEAGRELSRFFFEEDLKDGMVRVGEGKFRVARVQDRVRYWHPDREFKWSPPGLWKFVTRVSDEPMESSDRGMSFGDSSPSSTSTAAATAAAAAGIAAAGGTFDGGGASAAFDGSGSAAAGGGSETSGATAY